MADLDMDFNPADVPEDDRSFSPLPAGEYLMQVIESELKDTKTGNGQQLVLTLEVMDGPSSGRKVWDRLNIRHTNADAQRIAQRGLADLCLAVGLPSIRNSEELHFKPFTAKVTIREDKTGQYGPSNNVRYKTGAGRPAGGQTQAHRPASQPASNSGANKPWKKAS
jgi:hypothetical protein